MIKTRSVVDYIYPTRIVAASEGVKNQESLLKHKTLAVSLSDTDFMLLGPKQSITLDFGKEYSAGLRLITIFIRDGEGPDYNKCLTRIRFGESVCETLAEVGYKDSTNDHYPRVFEQLIPFLSDISVGHSGFRFARIDNLDDKKTICFKQIVLEYQHLDVEEVSRFHCNDEMVNKIYDYSLRTAYMCGQNGFIYDGIKRDRLVWCGDMGVEVKTYLETYGDLDVIRNSLDFCEEGYPLPQWVNNMPTYSLWWLLNAYEYYLYSKDIEWLKRKAPFIKGTTEKFLECIDKDGNVKIGDDNPFVYFIDWPSSESIDTKAAAIGLMKMTLEKSIYLFKELGFDTNNIEKSLQILKKIKMSDSALKGLLALQELAFNEGLGEELVKDDDENMSTFMAYHIFKAMAHAKKNEDAVRIMKLYYGKMVDKGATTFFEDFQPEWAKNTIGVDEMPFENRKWMHGDFGRFCYPGLRLSLCHGWASGPAPFLIEEVAGLSLVDDNVVRFSPNLSGLEFVEASIMTKYGPVYVEINKDGKKVVSKPKEVRIVD